MECEQGVTNSLPGSGLEGPDVLLADTLEGKLLAPEHGGLVRMPARRRHSSKSDRWPRGLKFVREEEAGKWEVRGCSELADLWAETRYATDDLRTT
jgi:DMSO/TMAO reductase YedYZ molybdopterin-dependent catalytic subunit